MSALRGRVLFALTATLAAAIWAGLVAYPHALGRASVIDPVENALFTLRSTSFGVLAPSESVVILAIDDAMLDAANPLGGGRQHLARLVEAAGAAGAAVIALDILLTDPGSPAGDAALEAALAKYPTVIAAGGHVLEAPAVQAMPSLREALWPLPRFTAQSDAGVVNISTDAAGVPRHLPIAVLTENGIRPSLAARTAALYMGEDLRLAGEGLTLGARVTPLDLGFQMPLRMAGPEGAIPTIPALDVLNGAGTERLSGKAVIIGVTATGLGDRFPTAFAPDLPGVEVMARAVDQLISGDVLRRDSMVRRLDVAGAILLAPLSALLVLFLPLTYGLTLGLGALGLWLAGVWLAFASGLWLSAALPLAAVAPPIGLATLFRYRREKRSAAQSDRAVAALKKFQSPLLAEQIARDPGFLSSPETRALVVCFIDLSGFTRASQGLGAQKTETFLKAFHRLLSTCAQENGGVVLNFMGDGALLVYGIPAMTKQTRDAALRAAFEMARGTADLSLAQRITPPLACRIGLHYGDVMLSRLGGDQHQQLTVSGDNVNLASRLLDIAKAESAVIAATDSFCDGLTQNSGPLPALTTDFPMRGRHGHIRVSLWPMQ